VLVQNPLKNGERLVCKEEYVEEPREKTPMVLQANLRASQITAPQSHYRGSDEERALRRNEEEDDDVDSYDDEDRRPHR